MRAALAAALLATFATASVAGDDDAPPRVELPLGPYVRANRPLDVRVIGGADRVRAPGTPWALPVGARGDEFLLQMPAAVSAPLDLTVERGAKTDHVTLAVTVLPADGTVVGVFGDATSPPDAVVVRLPTTDLPGLSEAWLLLDDVAGPSRELVPRQFNSVKSRARSAWGFFVPSLLPADPRPFDATAHAAVRAPLLPRDVAVVLALLAATEVALAFFLAYGSAGPWRRTCWLATPPLAAVAFLATSDRLPGALRAEATAVYASQYRTALMLVRVEARRAGSATFDLPPSATPAAVLRYSSDDATVETVAAGTRVEMDVPAGQTRIFAYALDAATWLDLGTEDRLFLQSDEPSLPPPLNEWLGDLGFHRYADGAGWYHFPSDVLPRAHGATVIAGLHALASGMVPPTK